MTPTHPLVRVREPGSCTLRAGCWAPGEPRRGLEARAPRQREEDQGRQKICQPPKSRAQPPPASPERAGCHPSRDLPATGPATPSRPFLSLRALGLAGGAGELQPRGRSRSRSPGLGPLPPPPTPPRLSSRPRTLALGRGKLQPPARDPRRSAAHSCPPAVEPCSATAPSPCSAMTSPGLCTARRPIRAGAEN